MCSWAGHGCREIGRRGGEQVVRVRRKEETKTRRTCLPQEKAARRIHRK